MATTDQAGMDALNRLKSTEPPLWLAPNPLLSETARTASQHLFSSLTPFAPKSPFEKLFVEGFDAEQIWQQIDLQSQPLLSNLRREIKRFEKNPEKISRFFELEKVPGVEEKDVADVKEDEDEEEDEESEDFDELDEDEDEEEEEEQGEEEEKDSKEKEGAEEKQGGIEDGFLKINELEEFLEEDEAREYGLEDKKKKKKKKEKVAEEEEEEEEEEEGEEDEGDDDELDLFGDVDGDDDEDMEDMENARYEDFFVRQKKNDTRKKHKMLVEESEEEEDSDSDMGDEMDEYEDESDIDDQERELEDLRSKVKQMEKVDVNKDNRSTHEKELEKLRSKIEEMEKSMLEPKPWIMQGEVTAAQRPKNSALEVDLDFEHNVRPAPVITEEVKASIEEMIQKRILDGHFDDVEKPPSLPTKAPREYKEMDENKSKKGLAEIYEEEYAEKTNLVPAALSFSDELKKEASMVFKKLCLKLDALSHFNFTPKPVIEDMSIQANVPALAMEEIAPVAVSDAAMLAPEEVFSGKGGIKEEAELTQEERKRRRARKKRKFKAEAAKRTVKKAKDSSVQNPDDGKS